MNRLGGSVHSISIVYVLACGRRAAAINGGENSMRDAMRCTARVALIVPFAALLCGPPPAWAGTILGTAANFAVLGASTVTNTGPTTLNGDLGVYPGTAITGGPPLITFIGASTIHNTPPGLDPISHQAQIDLATAYNTLAALPFTSNLTGFVLGSAGHDVFTPGVYRFRLVGSVDRNTHSQRRGRPECALRFPDWERPHDRKRLDC